MEKSDDQLIEEYRAGDENSFRFLVERYTQPIYRFAYRMTHNRELSEDITQETFVKVWKTLSSYKIGQGSCKPWIFTIARNTTIDQLRKKKLPVLSDFEDNEGRNYIEETASDPDTIPGILIEKAENKNIIDESMNELPLEDREILILHYQEEMTFEAIGSMIKKPLNTVKSKHRRALQKLKKILENKP